MKSARLYTAKLYSFLGIKISGNINFFSSGDRKRVHFFSANIGFIHLIINKLNWCPMGCGLLPFHLRGIWISSYVLWGQKYQTFPFWCNCL